MDSRRAAAEIVGRSAINLVHMLQGPESPGNGKPRATTTGTTPRAWTSERERNGGMIFTHFPS